MAMKAVSANATRTQAAASFIGGLGLPSTFLDLNISGLETVLESEELTPRNKELIARFLNHISPEVSEARLAFYTHKLRRLGAWLKKDLDAATEQDLRSLVTFLSKGSAREDGGMYRKGTLHGYKVAIKRFYRWLEGDDEEYPKKVKWIKSNGDAARIQEPEQLLSLEEVVEMIRRAGSPRDRAMISFLYESGARISEMLSMKMRHVEFDAKMVRATLPVSKTRPRVIPLVSCRRHVATWMNCHPLKDDPEAHLWSNLKRDGSSPLQPQTVGRILRQAAARADIRKRVYPHLFRACSITHKQAAGWPEQAVKVFHGLSKDSKVMKHYSHLSYGSLEQIQRRMNGMPADETASPDRGVRCAGCGRENPLYVETCACGMPTEMKLVARCDGPLDGAIERRVEQKVLEFIESRHMYDRVMDHFMRALLDKSRQSPLLMKAMGEIGQELQGGSLRVRPVDGQGMR